MNIHRMAFVASELARSGAIAICSAIAPYNDAREEARQLVSQNGGFFLIHLATPLETCEARDRKGVYRRAKAGEIKGLHLRLNSDERIHWNR
jgi:sulfate adenylyltransferase